MPSIIEVEVVCCINVWGKVQGISLREWVKEQAEELGLSGFAENDSNGCHVEIVLKGRRKAVIELKDKIVEKGPPGAEIKRFEVEWRSKNQFQGKGFETK